jgi:hypothetical protein
VVLVEDEAVPRSGAEPGSGIASIAISVAAAGQGPTRCEEMPDPSGGGPARRQ